MKKYKIEPSITLTIDIHSLFNIVFIIRDKIGNILSMTNIIKNISNYKTRQSVIAHLDYLIQEYQPDTLIYEQNQLFIDKIDRYPDPLVMRNIKCGFGIKVSIEDKYYGIFKYILELPEQEWRKCILNTNTKYSIDLYKAHILEQSFTEEQLTDIELNNYYKALCLSESIWFDRLMNRKYQINKGD